MFKNQSTLKKNLDELATGGIGRLLLKYSWPALVAMTLNALYCVVDRFYIGQGCGTDAMAGLTLTYPIMLLFTAFGVLIGAGHSSILSIRLGAGDLPSCEKLIGQLVAFKLLFFVTLPPLVFCNLDTVLGWCGADKVSPGAFAAAKDYLRIVLFPHLFAHLAFGLSSMMRAEGTALRSMICMVIGFGVNLILDPILIFGCGMGIAGAAWATNVAMFLSCAFALYSYLRGKTVIPFRFGRIGFHRGLVWRPLAIGFSPFLTTLLSSLIGVSLSVALTRWSASGDEATAQLASLGVFQSVLILVFTPIMGAQQGLQPILGYNWGARNFRRVLSTVRTGFWVVTAMCIVACIIQCVPPFPTLLARCFISSDNPALIQLAAHDLAVANCMLWCISINVVATTYFQSIGHPTAAVLLSLLRQGICLLPCIWILPHFMENRSLAVWLALPISDVLCQLATAIPFGLNLRFLARVRTRESLRTA